MDFLFKGSDCPSNSQDIKRCPFLSNINKPTSFLDSTASFPTPVRGAKGPIFEDGPNFDTAFKLFHGKDGVPLSGNSVIHNDNLENELKLPLFNPLAAKAATISLSSFGPGGPVSFDSFSTKWDKLKKKSQQSKKRDPTSKGDSSKHEAMGNEWLETGNCPIAKSYRVVSGVLPLVASALQPPPGMKFKCPPAVVAALARIALVKTLCPQPLSEKMLVIGVMGMAANVPLLGIWREHTRKFSLSWFAAVHAAVPFIAMLRKSMVMPKTEMALTIAASILGQVILSNLRLVRLCGTHLPTSVVNLRHDWQPLPVTRTTCGVQCGISLGTMWGDKCTSSSANICF